MKNNGMLKLIFAAAAALLSLGMVSSANAIPMLQIVDSLGNPMVQTDFTVPITTAPNNGEVTGDPGGSVYPYPGGPGAGAGVPSSIWPAGGPGFAPDPSFGNVLGTSGWHSGYLNLTEAADVTFQFMGAGNSSLVNQFLVNNVPIFVDGATAPCAVNPAGATTPSCTPGNNQRTFHFNAGLISFQYLTGNGVLLDNTGAGLGNPDPHDPTLNLPGYFLGVDPYLATGTFQNIGRAVYAGLSDLPAPGDHDFQDMGVRISVPEPGSLALLGAGLIGLAFGRRAKTAAVRAFS